jgi:ATP-dependent exoDNAse (exonuclease V) beta subunit
VPHISYSELKDWVHCAFYHKLTRVDGVDGFKGNTHTAFGTAMHSVCEKKLLQEDVDDDFFIQEFENCLEKLDDDIKIDNKLVEQMRTQGKQIIPEINDALKDYFEEFEVLAVEMQLYEPIETEEEYKFKGYIDAIVATPDGKVHIFDWKTCSWGWDSRKKSDKMVTYQLTLYKHFFCQKMGVDPANVETHFALLKRTAKKNRVEFFRVTSGEQKTKNALKTLNTALYNIKKKRYIKNKLSCTSGYGCKFYGTEHCP